MNDVLIDTNVVIWYFTRPTLPSATAQEAVSEAFNSGTIFVSAVTVVELTYLIEKGRIPGEILASLNTAIDEPATAFRLIELGHGVVSCVKDIPREIVPDMPDRIIAASALHLDIPLITSDAEIRKLANVKVIW